MELELKVKSSNEMTVDLDLELINKFSPQIWLALIHRKKTLLEIKEHVLKDEKFAEKVINVVRDSDTPGSALATLENKFELSNETAEGLLNSSLSNPIWNYEKKLAEVEDLLKILKCIQREEKI